MIQQLAPFVEELLSVHKQLLTEKQELETKLRGIDLGIQQVEGALSVWNVKPKKAKVSNRSRKAGNYTNKQEVLEIMVRLVRENGPLSHDDLQGLAKSKLSEMGKSLSGFGLHFKNAMIDPEFQQEIKEMELSVQSKTQPTKSIRN
jgi:hypothetical protein